MTESLNRYSRLHYAVHCVPKRPVSSQTGVTVRPTVVASTNYECHVLVTSLSQCFDEHCWRSAVCVLRCDNVEVWWKDAPSTEFTVSRFVRVKWFMVDLLHCSLPSTNDSLEFYCAALLCCRHAVSVVWRWMPLWHAAYVLVPVRSNSQRAFLSALWFIWLKKASLMMLCFRAVKGIEADCLQFSTRGRIPRRQWRKS